MAVLSRMAKEGETVVLLDGSEATLNADTLVIADHHKALGIAGIFGGEYSGVNGETQNVLLSVRTLIRCSSLVAPPPRFAYRCVSPLAERGGPSAAI